jgi:hypothetical protein
MYLRRYSLHVKRSAATSKVRCLYRSKLTNICYRIHSATLRSQRLSIIRTGEGWVLVVCMRAEIPSEAKKRTSASLTPTSWKGSVDKLVRLETSARRELTERRRTSSSCTRSRVVECSSRHNTRACEDIEAADPMPSRHFKLPSNRGAAGPLTQSSWLTAVVTQFPSFHSVMNCSGMGVSTIYHTT